MKDSWFYRQVKETAQLIMSMINHQHIDIHIIDIKGHCIDPVRLKQYLDKKTPGFNIDDCRFILYGNHLIDTLVNISKFRILHMNLPYNK